LSNQYGVPLTAIQSEEIYDLIKFYIELLDDYPEIANEIGEKFGWENLPNARTLRNSQKKLSLRSYYVEE